MSCEQCRYFIAQLVTGELDPEERAELRAHLESGCARCAESLAQTRELALALSLSPDPVEPSPRARQRLLARLDPAEAPVASGRAPARADRRLASPLVAGMSAVAAGIAVALFFTLQSAPLSAELDVLRAQLAPLQSQRVELEAELAELRSELELSDEEIMEVEARIQVAEAEALNFAKQVEMLSSEGVVAMSIDGTARQPRARASVFWGEDYYCYLTAENLHTLAAGRTYALWLETENHGVVLAGSFASNIGGAGTLWVPLDRDLGQISRAFVTEEEKDAIGQRPTGPTELESPADI